MSGGTEAALLERLARLDAAAVSDVLDEAGFPTHVLAPDFRPLDPNRKLAGRAFCALGEPRVATQSQRAAALPSPFDLEERVSPGDVVVIDAGGLSAGAAIGGFMAHAFRSRGAAGVIVNGAVRDAREIRAMGIATFARFASPANASRRWELVALDRPVHLPAAGGGAVSVRPGDLLLGDEDGVVVIPHEVAEGVVAAAEELAAIEQRIMAEMENGAARREAFGRHPRFRHIRQLRAWAQ